MTSFTNAKFVLLPPSSGVDDNWHITDDGDTCVLHAYGFHHAVDDDSKALAERALSCLNACVGIPTEILESGSAGMLNYSIELKEQRDRLIRDMQDVLDMLIGQPHAVTAANQAEDMIRLSLAIEIGNHFPDAAKMVPDGCHALMTLDEAIAHAYEKSIGDSQCAAQHAQLAKWLDDYRSMLAAAPKLGGE